MTIPEMVVFKLDEEISMLKFKGKSYWARFDLRFSETTIEKIKSYCQEKHLSLEINECVYGTYDIIISW